MDTSAGPYKNYTVVFLGSDNGHVLKILASTEGANASFGTQLLEDVDVYNPNKSVCPMICVCSPSVGPWSALPPHPVLALLYHHPVRLQGMLLFLSFLYHLTLGAVLCS